MEHLFSGASATTSQWKETTTTVDLPHLLLDAFSGHESLNFSYLPLAIHDEILLAIYI
jgi:hypothetical protein